MTGVQTCALPISILKSQQAVRATLAIIETFSKMRGLSRNIKTLSSVKNENEQQNLMKKSGEIIAEILEDDLQTTDKIGRASCRERV